MNELTVFNNEEFGQLRTIQKDGEPWFVANDVCRILEISNSRAATERLDEDEKAAVSLTDISSNGISQQRTMTVVNEPGLYTLVLGSRKPEARQFKRWVTHEVIPSIRKHGAYISGQTEMTREQLLAKAYKAMIEIDAENKKRIEALTNENSHLQRINSLNTPKVVFATSVEATNGEILIGELAKILKQNGINVGQNKLYKQLRKDKLIMKNSTFPTQYGMERGWFRITEYPIKLGDGSEKLVNVTKVTTKGQIALINKYLDKYYEENIPF